MCDQKVSSKARPDLAAYVLSKCKEVPNLWGGGLCLQPRVGQPEP